jgi:hypothetical protein
MEVLSLPRPSLADRLHQQKEEDVDDDGERLLRVGLNTSVLPATQPVCFIVCCTVLQPVTFYTLKNGAQSTGHCSECGQIYPLSDSAMVTFSRASYAKLQHLVESNEEAALMVGPLFDYTMLSVRPRFRRPAARKAERSEQLFAGAASVEALRRLVTCSQGTMCRIAGVLCNIIVACSSCPRDCCGPDEVDDSASIFAEENVMRDCVRAFLFCVDDYVSDGRAAEARRGLLKQLWSAVEQNAGALWDGLRSVGCRAAAASALKRFDHINHRVIVACLRLNTAPVEGLDAHQRPDDADWVDPQFFGAKLLVKCEEHMLRGLHELSNARLLTDYATAHKGELHPAMVPPNMVHFVDPATFPFVRSMRASVLQARMRWAKCLHERSTPGIHGLSIVSDVAATTAAAAGNVRKKRPKSKSKKKKKKKR